MEVARATLREELGDSWAKNYEVYYHGSSSGQERIGEESIPPGKVFTSATLGTAEIFAHRKVSRVPGEPTMTAIIFQRGDFDRARSMGYVTVKQIDDMPGKIETIFHPDALDRFAEFIIIPKG
jgi:hypothetical protein